MFSKRTELKNEAHKQLRELSGPGPLLLRALVPGIDHPAAPLPSPAGASLPLVWGSPLQEAQG